MVFDSGRDFIGPNLGYVLDLYERYLKDPQSVDPAARAFFASWQPPEEGAALPTGEAGVLSEGNLYRAMERANAVANLAEAIRHYGHLAAHLDPLGGAPPGDPLLDLAAHKLSEEDLGQLPANLVGGPFAPSSANARQVIQKLKQIYEGNAGYDYGHVVNVAERDWLRDSVESGTFRSQMSPDDARCLLERLTQVEVFERFLQRSYPGRTRFSIEGVDMLIPMLDEIIVAAIGDSICMVFLGMAHRGRLNVLAHILQKPYVQLLAEFKEPASSALVWHELGYTGDVKYHKGGLRAVTDDSHPVELVIQMPPNPSHLEFIDPVVEGMARSADSGMDKPGAPRFFPKASLPILIHGDASFPGQGVVAETLNLSRLSGYSTAGTIHIITNNQLGYTTSPGEGRSSMYASDLAKGLKIPIIHVNADDAQACLEAARTAFAYREQFQKDFLIDLVGYRRYGHNEGDEPSFTQPLMYQMIEEHPTARALWAKTLEQRGIIQAGQADEMVKNGLDELQKIFDGLKPEEALSEPLPAPAPPGAARHTHTAVPLDRLKELNEALLNVPDDFHLNRKLDRPRRRRSSALDNPEETSVDWATAEDLAFASILADGTPIRLTGQDVERGTFSQRHAVLHDVENGSTFTPLQALPQARASFEIHNSPLSESSAVGFEFGFSIFAPSRFVLWEAQYGDFINAAQGMTDEFVVSARSKWGQKPSLVMLLPHGNEGQGPDHSSARPERFLQLAAEINMRLAYPTTAAQYFHLLRRQAALLNMDPLPLVVLTPKGMLRHPLTASRPDELSEGSWHPVLDDPSLPGKPNQVRRVALCSGRIYADLASNDQRPEAKDLAILRLEQLYLFPATELQAVFDRYASLKEVLWVQEEPQNMGFWEYLRPHLLELIQDRWPLHYLGRPASPSPAEGSASWYAANQQSLINQVLGVRQEAPSKGLLVERE